MNDTWMLDLAAATPSVSVWLYLPLAVVMLGAMVLLTMAAVRPGRGRKGEDGNR
jgi:hypothetical protein